MVRSAVDHENHSELSTIAVAVVALHSLHSYTAMLCFVMSTIDSYRQRFVVDEESMQQQFPSWNVTMADVVVHK